MSLWTPGFSLNVYPAIIAHPSQWPKARYKISVVESCSMLMVNPSNIASEGCREDRDC